MVAVRARILTASDISPRIGENVRKALVRSGVDIASTAAVGEDLPIVLLFHGMSPDAFETIRELGRGGAHRVLGVAMSTSLDACTIWRLLKSGASEVLSWDRSAEPGAEIAAHLARWTEVDALVRSNAVKERLVGRSAAWLPVLQQIVEIARFTDASVLICGESGTGKELVARLIHELDVRGGKRELVVLDCATVVPSLSGSEFFGHEKGAFTGAITTRDGAFARADRGTLFLDEVGELPAQLQAELLRVIQEGLYKRVGSDTWRRTNFRLLCATNRDLLEDVADRRFRPDLYHRIAAFSLRLPRLCERQEDILPLAMHFLRQLAGDRRRLELEDAVADLLIQRSYPGNIRELKHLITRIWARHAGPGPITAGDVPPDERPSTDADAGDWRDGPFEDSIRRALALGKTLGEIRREAVERAIRIAETEANGNLQYASRRLGVTDRALQMRRARDRPRLQPAQRSA